MKIFFYLSMAFSISLGSVWAESGCQGAYDACMQSCSDAFSGGDDDSFSLLIECNLTCNQVAIDCVNSVGYEINQDVIDRTGTKKYNPIR